MAEQCKANGSIQKLDSNSHKWVTVGIGTVSLLKNHHNPEFILLKLVRKKNGQTFMFQCKPKVKPNGKSLILKGTNTRKNREYVLALRFNDENAMDEFEEYFNDLFRKNLKENPKLKRHSRNNSLPPKELRLAMQNESEWICELCSFKNEAGVFDCEVCKRPRPLTRRESHHKPQSSIDTSSLPPLVTPSSNSMSPTTAKNINAIKFPDNIDDMKLQAISEIEKLNSAESPGDFSGNEVDESEDENENKGSEKEEENEEKSSIKELIEKVTNGEDISSIKCETVESILLLCHNVFTDSMTMLQTLLNRLCDAQLSDANARIRGVKMCEKWIRDYWENDFVGNDQMMDIMYSFIDNLADITNLDDNDIRLLGRIKKTFQEAANAQHIKAERQNSTLRSAKLAQLTGVVDIPKNYGTHLMSKESAISIAEQLTLMDFAIFKKVTKREMTGQAWKKKDREQRAPNLLKMIEQFNSISLWVVCVVLQQKTKKDRARCMMKFIHIATHLRKMRNFSACCAVNFGLIKNEIHRQNAAWKEVKRSDLRTFNEIQEIFKKDKNWKKLRVLHKNAHAPSILHTGLFLSDLFNLDEGNQDKKKDGTVNFGKLKKTYDLIEQIAMYQQEEYEKKDGLQPNEVMQNYLKMTWKLQKSYTEDQMYTNSKTCQKKDEQNVALDEDDIALMAW